jgi:C4-type Zn-finger protein
MKEVGFKHIKCPNCNNEYLTILEEKKQTDYVLNVNDYIIGRKYYCDCCNIKFEINYNLEDLIKLEKKDGNDKN